MSSTSYEAWARYDVDKELDRVDDVAQKEQLQRQREKKVAEKRGVEESISRDAEQSADVLAAQAAVAALKAKSRARGRSANKKDASAAYTGVVDARQAAVAIQEQRSNNNATLAVDPEMLQKLADAMKQKHTLIKEIMDARKQAEALTKGDECDWHAAQCEYERALASGTSLESKVPELMALQEAQAALTGHAPPADHPLVSEASNHNHEHGSHCEHDHSHSHTDDVPGHHEHGHGCCSGDGHAKAKPAKAKQTESLPKSNDLPAVVKMFLMDCYLGIGVCAMEKGHHAAASEAFKEVLLRDQGHLLAWLRRGRAFEAMNAPLLAWLHYNRVTGQDSEFEDAKECEVRIKGVLLVQEQASPQSPENPSPETTVVSLKDHLLQIQLAMDAGSVIMIEGFFEYAIAKYDKALKLIEHVKNQQSLTNVMAVITKLELTCHLNIASCTLEMHKHLASGLLHCQLALEIDPSHLVANFRLAQLYRAMHMYESALGSYHTVKTLVSYLPPMANARSIHTTTLDDEIDKCQYERSQYDTAYIRQLLQESSCK